LIDSLKAWLESQLPRVPRSLKLAEAIRYTLNHWPGLIRFLDDGRLELDNNCVERSMRPVGLQRKNALFAGHHLGAENWAAIASLIETCKLNDIDPLAYFTDVLSRVILRKDGDPIDDLLPAQWVLAYTQPTSAEFAKVA